MGRCAAFGRRSEAKRGEGEQTWWGEAPEQSDSSNVELDLAKPGVCFADLRAEPCPSVCHSPDFAIRLISLRFQRSGSMADAGIGSAR